MFSNSSTFRLENLDQTTSLAKLFGQVVGEVVSDCGRPVTISVYASSGTGKTTFIRSAFPFIHSLQNREYLGWAYRLAEIESDGQLHRHFDCAPPADENFGWKSDRPRPAGKTGLEIYEHGHEEMLVNSDLVVFLAQPNDTALHYLRDLQRLIKRHCTKPYVYVHTPAYLPLRQKIFRKAKGLCQSNKEARAIGKRILPIVKETARVTEKKFFETQSPPPDDSMRLLRIASLSEDYRIKQAVRRFNERAQRHASPVS